MEQKLDKAIRIAREGWDISNDLANVLVDEVRHLIIKNYNQKQEIKVMEDDCINKEMNLGLLQGVIDRLQAENDSLNDFTNSQCAKLLAENERLKKTNILIEQFVREGKFCASCTKSPYSESCGSCNTQDGYFSNWKFDYKRFAEGREQKEGEEQCT